MKIKLNAVLASVLSLGVVCSGSAFAISSDNEDANIPVYREISEDNDNLTEEVTEEEPEVANVSTLTRHRAFYGFEFYLHVHCEDKIKQILNELKSGELGEICAILEYDDFINLDNDTFEEKVNFWGNVISENNMVKERNLLDDLVELINDARQEYDFLYPED